MELVIHAFFQQERRLATQLIGQHETQITSQAKASQGGALANMSPLCEYYPWMYLPTTVVHFCTHRHTNMALTSQKKLYTRGTRNAGAQAAYSHN